MATKPWPIATTLAAPLKVEGEGEVIGLVAAAVVTAAVVPVAGEEPLPATGYGVEADGATGAEVAGADIVTGPLELTALAVVETWLSVLSPAAEMIEVGAEAIEPVATQGKVEM